MYYCYILQSEISAKLYVGSTADLKQRLEKHNASAVKSTKSGVPWKLIYYEAYREKLLARRSELFYKKSQGRRQIKKKLALE
jgi:putative endonuclease